MATRITKAETRAKTKIESVKYPDNTSFPTIPDELLAKMRPAHDVHPPEFFEAVKRARGQRGPGRRPAKVPFATRIDHDVYVFFKKEGENLGTIVRDVLRQRYEKARGFQFWSRWKKANLKPGNRSAFPSPDHVAVAFKEAAEHAGVSHAMIDAGVGDLNSAVNAAFAAMSKSKRVASRH